MGLAILYIGEEDAYLELPGETDEFGLPIFIHGHIAQIRPAPYAPDSVITDKIEARVDHIQISNIDTQSIKNWWCSLKKGELTFKEMHKGTTFGRSVGALGVVARALKVGIQNTSASSVSTEVRWRWTTADLSRYANSIQQKLRRPGDWVPSSTQDPSEFDNFVDNLW